MRAGAPSVAVIRGGRRGPIISSVVLVSAPLLLAAGIAFDAYGPRRVALVAVIVAAVATVRSYVKWTSLLAMILLTIMFIPIGRYTLPVSLPFQLEPYRVLVGLVLLAWFISLLVDSRVTFRWSAMQAPVAVFSFVVILSLLTNPVRVEHYESVVVKRLMFLASFILLYLMIVAVVRRADQVWLLMRVLVGAGAVVAFFAIIESRTGYNIFDHLSRVLPFLRHGIDPNQTSDITGYRRGGSVRAYASAQHPIALGAALIMLLPIAVALARKTRQRRWWVAAAVLTIGSMATLSRESIVMLIVVVVVFLRERPVQTRKLWPALLPLAVAMHFALPGVLGTLKDSFFPKGGLVAQQQHGGAGSGRLASLGPALHNELLPHPFFGEGFGTRITTNDGGVATNAPILDDEWLGVLTETGVAGALAFAWVFFRFLRRAGRVAKQDESPEGWLLTAIVAAVASFGIGMMLFDAFSFTQTTFLFFMIMAFGVVLYERAIERASAAPASSPAGSAPVSVPAVGSTAI